MIYIAANRHAWALNVACDMQLTADEWVYVREANNLRSTRHGGLLLIHPSVGFNRQELLDVARARCMTIAEIRE